MAEPQLIPVFIPALVAILLNAERKKGSPLTEQEVLDIRDGCVYMMMPVEHAIALDAQRGYNDIDPERAWEQWQEARAQLEAAGEIGPKRAGPQSSKRRRRNDSQPPRRRTS
jgi:hypothetical protein